MGFYGAIAGCYSPLIAPKYRTAERAMPQAVPEGTIAPLASSITV